MTSEDPLEDLYADEPPYDRQRLADVLESVVQVNEDTGDPMTLPPFGDLDPEAQCVALLLYRHVVVELGERPADDEAVEPIWLAQNADIEEDRVIEFASDRSFVEESDERGGYYVPKGWIDAAVDHLESSVS
mgnify:CR=1 FL=1